MSLIFVILLSSVVGAAVASSFRDSREDEIDDIVDRLESGKSN